MCNIIIDSKHNVEEPIDHIVLISKHPNQACYLELAKSIKTITFITPESEVKEREFLESLNLKASKHTALFFDDL